MNKLEQAIEKILAGSQPDEWTELCIATIRLGHALAVWDDALKKYKRSKKDS